MFDINYFKQQVKAWMQSHPDGEIPDLVDLCEELIPSAYFASHQWLIDQTVSWFKHIQSNRETSHLGDADEGV